MAPRADHVRRQQLVDRWHDGATNATIAAEFGLNSAGSASAIISRLRASGVQPSPGRPSGRRVPISHTAVDPATIAPTEAAWAAGFIDGEGCFFIRRHTDSKRGCRPLVAVSQIDTQPLHLLQGWFGGNMHTRAQRAELRRVTAWQLSDTAAILTLLDVIEPFLIVKARHAALMREYLIGVGAPYANGGGRRPMSAELLAARQACAEYMSQLNRGVAAPRDRR